MKPTTLGTSGSSSKPQPPMALWFIAQGIQTSSRSDCFVSGLYCVCGCVGVVWAVNREVVEGRNLSKDCAVNQSQKCFMFVK